MKQKLVNCIKDFLKAIIGENENVWQYLESYVMSETSLPAEQVGNAVNKFVENLNEVNATLKNNSDTVPLTQNNIKGISSKPSTNSENMERSVTAATKNDAPLLPSNETVKDSSPDKSTPQNGPSVSAANKNLVQIVANKSEIERRIASFIECKRMDVDEENRREFCSDLYPEHGDGDQCARTSAVFVARSGGRSHVAVSRVVNANGPQLRVLSCTPSMTNLPDVKCEPGSMMHNYHLNVAGELPIKQEPKDIPSGIEERVKNMEAHLKISPDSISNKSEIFERLKALEKRILFLESISPEYFNIQLQSSNLKKRKILPSPCKTTDATNKDLSLVEIDERINRLRNILKKKQQNLDDT